MAGKEERTGIRLVPVCETETEAVEIKHVGPVERESQPALQKATHGEVAVAADEHKLDASPLQQGEGSEEPLPGRGRPAAEGPADIEEISEDADAVRFQALQPAAEVRCLRSLLEGKVCIREKNGPHALPRVSHDPETDAVKPVVGSLEPTARHPQALVVHDPGSATEDTSHAVRGAGGVDNGALCVGPLPVPAPLPDVSAQVVEAPGIWL